MIYKNFTAYVPEDEVKLANHLNHGVQYVKSEDGTDWYDLVETLNPDDWKLLINPENDFIYCISTEAHLMNPTGFSVAIVSELPEGMSDRKEWKYNNGNFYKDEARQLELLTEQKGYLLKAADVALRPLTFAEELGEASKADLALITKIKKYMLEVHRMTDWTKVPKKPF